VNSVHQCFLIDRLAVDDFVKIRIDLFTDNEILLARRVIDKLGGWAAQGGICKGKGKGKGSGFI